MDASHDQPGLPPNLPANEDIELEPTRLAQSEASFLETLPAESASDYSPDTSVGREFTDLLRFRLLAAAGCFLVVHVIFSVLAR